jgi:hypothetical protein
MDLSILVGHIKQSKSVYRMFNESSSESSPEKEGDSGNAFAGSV